MIKKKIVWKFYKGALIPDVEPTEEIEISSIDAKKILAKTKKTLLIRYTTEFDSPYEMHWWYCIKDSIFDIEKIKSKRRNVIKNGISNFNVKIINPKMFIEDFYVIINDSNSEYKKNYKFSKEEAISKCEILSKNCNDIVIGAFLNNEKSKYTKSILCGYLWLRITGKCVSLVEQHVKKEYEKLQINAALIYKACKMIEDKISEGFYLCDGERNIVHETAFQDYLIKYFNFRKAYCKLNIIYRPYVHFAVIILYPLKNYIINLNKIINHNYLSKILGILRMEEIMRKQK